MSYYVTVMVKGALSGNLIEGCGSFYNFIIDGRLSYDNALEVARENAVKETTFKGVEYLGFKIAKGDSWYCINDKTKVVL